jgi:hypothetical protein
MLGKIYYQDFELNATNFKGPPTVDKDKAIFIVQFDHDVSKESREEFCDKCYAHMNQLCVPKGHRDRPLFEKAGHTSMSIGDYVQFEDGKIYVCARAGWEII